jgi:hypothetical protein
MKRQVHRAEGWKKSPSAFASKLLKEGRYLGRSPDVAGLVAERRTVAETIEIAQGLAAKSWNLASNTAIHYHRFFVPNNAQTKNFSCLQ